MNVKNVLALLNARPRNAGVQVEVSPVNVLVTARSRSRNVSPNRRKKTVLVARRTLNVNLINAGDILANVSASPSTRIW